ncbi:nucleotidyltransferase family protein [Sphingomonas sp.]|uniref:nucleotidyltransferase family protein n=1 Tax=Sphingomonas sp. TaxID=28214 RepID=UPI0025D8084E|nr:nucleotidyltransferase family protein [Sphingomonas sp.]
MSASRRTLRLRAEVAAEVPDTAMVMAAGLGKRMRPLTATKPKPLIEVAGKALLDHVLDRLRAAGVKKVVVNVHYLADVLEAHLVRSADELEVTISDERPLLLETGGGLVRAQSMIECDPFLAINSDNLWVDGPADTLKLLASHWDGSKMDALLLLVPHARAMNHKGLGDFHLDRAGRLRRRGRSRVAPFVYTGLQIISKRLLRDAPEGPFSTNLFWDRAIAEGRCYGAVHQGLWFDVGNPEAIRATEQVLANA